MIDVLAMEDAILQALGGLTALRHVDSYQGGIDAALERGIFPLPAALVAYGGARPESEATLTATRAKVKVSFAVFVIGRNLRGKKEAAQDARALLGTIRGALHGLRMGQVVLLWQSESLEIVTETGTCVFAQGYEYTDYLVQ